MSEPYVPWIRIREAIEELCQCGGAGPTDPEACVACAIFHRLKERAVTFQEMPATDEEVEAS